MIIVTLRFGLEMFHDEHGKPIGITPELEAFPWALTIRRALAGQLEALGVANVVPGTRELAAQPESVE